MHESITGLFRAEEGQSRKRRLTLEVDRFDSINELIAEVTGPVRQSWERDPRYTPHSTTRSKFTLTDNFDHAVSLARKGWPEGLKNMVRDLAQASLTTAYERVPSIHYDVGGMMPDVPRFVSGDPYNMMDFGYDESKSRPIVRLWVPKSVSGAVRTEHVVNYGVALLSHVDRLEEQGFSVELTLVSCSRDSDCKTLYSIQFATAKRAGDPLDLDTLAFMLAHPSYQRRFIFAMYDRYMPQSWQEYYGYPCRLPPDLVEPGVNYLPGLSFYDDTSFATIERAVEAMSAYVGPTGQGIEVELKDGVA